MPSVVLWPDLCPDRAPFVLVLITKAGKLCLLPGWGAGVMFLSVPSPDPWAQIINCWFIQQGEGKWRLLVHQYMKEKRSRKQASRRIIGIGHLFNKREFKCISCWKIKLERPASLCPLVLSQRLPSSPLCCPDSTSWGLVHCCKNKTE